METTTVERVWTHVTALTGLFTTLILLLSTMYDPSHPVDTLSLDDPELPELYFPMDQQILLYLPFWIPMLVPCLRGIRALYLAYKSRDSII